MVRQARLDDWPGVKALWIRFSMSRFSKRVQGTLETIENYFAASLTRQDLRLFVLDVEGELKGICILHDAHDQTLADSCQPLKVAFLRILHVESGVPEEHRKELHEVLNDWAKFRGASMMTGYCCMDFPFKAYEELHGIKPLYVVVGKEVV